MSATEQPLVLNTATQRFVRLGWALILVLLVGFVAWAGFAPLDQGLSISGQVTVEGSRKRVQHPTGGIVERILVQDGDQVLEGQALLRMNTTTLNARRRALQTQYLEALANAARLRSELEGRPTIDFSDLQRELPDHPSFAEQTLLQQQIFTTRNRTLALEIQALEQNLQGAREQRTALQATLGSKQRQLVFIDEQLNSLRRLADQNLIPRNRLLENERLYAQIAAGISEDIGRMAALDGQLLELQTRIQQRQEERQNLVGKELASARADADRLRNALDEVNFDLDNAIVRAPVAGTVVGLQVFTEGGTLQPGQDLLELVPADQPLIVEGRVPAQQIDRVYPDLPVEMLFTAFNQSTTPRIPGQVRFVAADALQDTAPAGGRGTDGAWYRLTAEISPEGQQLDLRPGMPVEIFIRMGERSLLNYLFKPLMDRAHMALIED